jgi:pullulanase/glycogen debranching enzyme
MKSFYYLLVISFSISCGNKKAAIVEEIKKTKGELGRAKLNQDAYSKASTHLRLYETSPKSVANIYKEAIETDKKYLTEADPEILNSPKKLDSVAMIWEAKVRDYTYSLDSLEMELKKY